MILYHGTHLKAAEMIKEKGILLSKGKPRTDFGKGFYTTEHLEFAKQTAFNKAKKSERLGIKIVPAVVRLNYNEYEHVENKLFFMKEDKNWLQFIINNRNGIEYADKVLSDFHNLRLGYDIVSGRIADNNIVFLADELQKEPRLVEEDDVSKVLYKNNPYASQISFHTEEALKTLKCEEIYILKGDNQCQ